MKLRDVLNVLVFAVLGMFGTIARELSLKNETALKTAKLVSSLATAAFGATMVYFVFSMTAMPEQVGYVAAGFVGWAGPTAIDKLFEKNLPELAGKESKKDDTSGKAVGSSSEPGRDEERE